MTPEVDEDKVAVTPLAGAHPRFLTVTFRVLHSSASTMPFPLPPEIVTGLGFKGSTIGLAVPLRHELKVVVLPLVILSVLVDGEQFRAPFVTVTE